MALCADVGRGQVRRLGGLQVAVARGAALEGLGLWRPQRDEADAAAGRVGVVAAEQVGQVLVVGGAVVHACVEVGGKERHQWAPLGILVALDCEGPVAKYCSVDTVSGEHIYNLYTDQK